MTDNLTITFTGNVGDDSFPIIISSEGLQALKAYLRGYSSDSVLIVADSVFRDSSFHPDQIISDVISSYPSYFLDGGIESKSFSALSAICDELFRKSIPRDGLIVALGGGVVGDIAGMAASIYQRGIRLIHVPTTATSMIDSCIGGKTGINHANQVNLLGTYYNPRGVFIDIRFLNTLPHRDLVAGIAEALKMSISSDPIMMQWLFANYSSVLSRDSSSLLRLVSWSVQIKLFHVSSDFKESSTRLLLNYGHTFGQALESYYGLYQDFLRHGEAVSLGMCCASSLADAIFPSNNDADSRSTRAYTHRQLLKCYGLPTNLDQLSLPSLPTPLDLYNNVFNDKKRTSQGLRFILTDAIGSAQIVSGVNKDQIIAAFAEIIPANFLSPTP